MSREKQDDWKRTQVRMPQDQYDSLMSYAEKNNLSLNTAILELMDKGLNSRIQKTNGFEFVDTRNNPLVKKEIYNQIKGLDFIEKLENEYNQQLDINKLNIEYLDMFGQCHVYLEFEDHFAMRDASGNWRLANAVECSNMTSGTLEGMSVFHED